MTAETEKASDDQPKIFLSYSRRDRERAQIIADVLRQREISVLKDTDDILPTEEWRERLEQLIEEADTIVFLLSPQSAMSEVCAWEVEYATSLNKRIAPIIIEDVDPNNIPPLITRLNFIFATERDPFEDAVDTLIAALNTDIDWIREHTRLNVLARRWDNAGRPSRLLLRGADISDAEAWRDGRPPEAPEVTGLQAAFVSGSREAATRRQRMTVLGSLVGLAIAIGLAGAAYWQRGIALENEHRATVNEKRANDTRDDAWRTQSEILTDWATKAADEGDRMTATLLSLAALPDEHAGPDRIDAARPLLPEAEQQLFRDHFLAQEAANLELPGEQGGDKPEIAEASFNPDGTLVLARTSDGSAHLWNAMTGRTVMTFDTQGEAVTSLAFSPDGSRIVTAFQGHRGMVWDTKSGRKLSELSGCQDKVKDRWSNIIAVFSPSGKLIVTAGASLCAWDAETGRLSQAIKSQDVAYRNEVRFVGAGDRLVFSNKFDRRMIILDDLETGKEFPIYRGIGGLYPRISPDGFRVVIGDVGTSLDKDGKPSTTSLWDLRTGKQLAVLSANECFTDVAFSPDGKILVASADKGIRMWNGLTGALLPKDNGLIGDREFLAQNDATMGEVQFTSDGRFVVGHDLNDTIKVWDLQGGLVDRLRKPETPDTQYTKFVLGPGLGRMLTFKKGQDPAKRQGPTLWSVGAPKNLKPLKDYLNPDGTAFFSPDVLERLAGYFRTRAEHILDGGEWPSRSDVSKTTIDHPDPAGELRKEGVRASWTKNQDTDVRIQTGDGNREIAVLKGHENPVRSVAFKPGSNVVATVSGKSLRVWQADTGKQIALIGPDDLSGADYRVRTVFFSGDGKRLLVVSEDFIDVFDGEDFTKILSLVSEDAIPNANPPPEYFDVSEGKFLSYLETSWTGDRWSYGKDAYRPRFWQLAETRQDLVDLEKANATRCLSPRQMKQYFLGDRPPRWCITGPGLETEPDPAKWRPKTPYNTKAWRDWLISRNKGQNPPVPVLAEEELD
ncbi:TIR domain-containing protein [Roseibium aggregatum]|uniref:TIR domain-containing protein n=1 Tax=Roseibium aggregatum TaxID=187304 RepID=A0A926S8A5_9HYPH|nr:TIR domain-containing protein [Roseibium aggregatum]MBD1549265.1 TIR domain-containing protein [Roseibium aggregatum]